MIFSSKTLRQNPSGNWVILISSGQKPCESTGKGGGSKGLWWCGIAWFLVQFCRNFYFKLSCRYCGFRKPSNLRYLKIFGVISMRFVVFFCYSVQCLYVILCSFTVFVPPLHPSHKDFWKHRKILKISFVRCHFVKFDFYFLGLS